MKNLFKRLTTTFAILLIACVSFGLSACFFDDDDSPSHYMIFSTKVVLQESLDDVPLVLNTDMALYANYIKLNKIADTTEATLEYVTYLTYDGTDYRSVGGIIDNRTFCIRPQKAGEITFTIQYNDGKTKLESEKITIEFIINEIKTVADLKALAGSKKSYLLVDDLDLSAETNWKPIADYEGTLHGNNHTISNLKIAPTSNDGYLGLFANLKGNVENLTIKDASIVSKRGNAGYAGMIAGACSGKISNCKVSGSINTPAFDYVGGLVGECNGGTITDCTSEVIITAVNNVGGAIGKGTVSTTKQFDQITSLCDVKGKENVGGIVGTMVSGDVSATIVIANMKNSGKIEGTSNVGGIFGYVEGRYQRYAFDNYFELSSLTNQGEIVGDNRTGESVGGILGKGLRVKTMSILTNTADVTGGNCVGGYIGYSKETNLIAAAEEDKNTKTIRGKAYVGGFAGCAGLIENAINEGEIISTTAAIVDNVKRAWVGGIAGYCTGLKNCVNNSDIEVTHDGQCVGGLAGYLQTAVLKDNVVDNENNGTVTANGSSVGGIAGYVIAYDINGTFTAENNTNNARATITGKDCVGGIFGSVYGRYERYAYDNYFEFSMLTNDAEVYGATNGEYTGGIIGYGVRVTKILVSENNNDITGGNYVGGLVGSAADTEIQTSATNVNTITGKAYVGGFAGVAGVIDGAHNMGEIVSIGTCVENTIICAYVGGIAGYCAGAIDCINESNITVTAGDYVGGIAGYVEVSVTEIVKNSENHGVITATNSNNVGGIAGCIASFVSGTYNINYNTNEKAVTGVNNVGGIFGNVLGGFERYVYDSYFEVTYNKNYGTIAGTNYVGGIVGNHNQLNLGNENSLVNTNETTSGDILGK